MIIKNRYYTPKLEEFHQGFEFELCKPVQTNRNNIRKDWISVQKYDDIDIIQYYSMYFPTHEMLRVYKLLPQDIIDLGWELEKLDVQSIEIDENTNYNIHYGFFINGKYKLTYRLVDIEEAVGSIEISDEYGIFAKAKIKNKSELKRYIRQVIQ